MRRALAAVGSAIFFLAAPGTVAGAVPFWLTGWMGRPEAFAGARPLGGLLVAFGFLGLADAFVRFVRAGGTPAPPLPTEELVVSGPYRHVRNPMYVAVLAAILGQALILSRPVLAGYALLVFALFHGFALLYEEPTLRARYGAAYDAYARAVPRWWPRLRPWSPPR